ncbi:MAG: chemotaxis protein CheA [Spirochaetes bacterium]|nr:chemotaxis protein CheA [Spirochaetota bacterium]
MAEKYDFNEAINVFFIESREMLEDMENALLDLEKDISDSESVSAIFRAVHTIKGSAGMFGFNDVGDFAHILENLLDKIRSSEIETTPDMVNLLLECNDHIIKLLDYFDANREEEINPELNSVSQSLLNKLNSYLPAGAGERKKEQAKNASDLDSGDMQVINECWHISLRFRKSIFKNGMDPQSFISYLSQMGKIVKIKAVTDAIPPAKEMNAEECYLGFEISFMAYTTKEKIEEVFEFIQDDCIIRILPPKSDLNEYVALIDNLPEETMYIGEILTEVGSLTKKELSEALKLQEGLKKDSKKRIGEIVVDEHMVHKPIIEAAVNKQSNIKKTEDKIKKTMRVDTSKLDKLINLVGELVISASNMERLIHESGNSGMANAFLQMSRLIDSIRESSMNVRMVEIGESFKRFERVVRDISREKGKQVDLVFHGGETELDKTIIEKVTDPLMHLVRNAADHGIELPEIRAAKGKPEKGIVKLNAYNEAGNIVIEINDDGAGLDRQKIINKAVERGLIKEEDLESVSNETIDELIFSSGFSTADTVTGISGRGVGMDVVRKNIESLRGSIIINSEEGKGTTIRIILPLTLAIIDGFLVKAGGLFCVLPLNSVVECSEFDNDEDVRLSETGNYIYLRDEIIPYVKMKDFFESNNETDSMGKIVVVRYADRKMAFLVDEAFGEFQTVIKPLGRIFNKIEWISGATIMAGGEIGLILDVSKLLGYLKIVETRNIS